MARLVPKEQKYIGKHIQASTVHYFKKEIVNYNYLKKKIPTNHAIFDKFIPLCDFVQSHGILVLKKYRTNNLITQFFTICQTSI